MRLPHLEIYFLFGVFVYRKYGVHIDTKAIQSSGLILRYYLWRFRSSQKRLQFGVILRVAPSADSNSDI